MDFTQKEVAGKSGLSIFTISTFENGSSTGITLASFIKLLRAIESLEEMEKLLPELPESPRNLYMKLPKSREHGKLRKFDTELHTNKHIINRIESDFIRL